MIGKPVDLFSFPFGRPDNIRAATMQIIQSAGYIANFSAHGGFIGPGTDPYYIPRAGAHYESSPVYCLLQIEGLTLSRIARKVRNSAVIRVERQWPFRLAGRILRQSLPSARLYHLRSVLFPVPEGQVWQHKGAAKRHAH
jgi:hypothetical protein